MDTFGELETQLRDRLDEVRPAHWESRQLIRWIYDGGRDVARKSECLRTVSTITAVVGQQEYTLPTDVVRMNRVTYQRVGENDRYPLDYVDFNSVDSMSWTPLSTGTPMMYTTWNFPPSLKLVAYPIPSDAGQFQVFYYRLPQNPFVDPDTGNPVTNPDTIAAVQLELPEGWQDVALDYAQYMALMQDADQRWQAYKSLYDEHLEDLVVTAIRFNDQAGMMNVGSRGSVPEWLWNEAWTGY